MLSNSSLKLPSVRSLSGAPQESEADLIATSTAAPLQDSDSLTDQATGAYKLDGNAL